MARVARDVRCLREGSVQFDQQAKTDHWAWSDTVKHAGMSDWFLQHVSRAGWSRNNHPTNVALNLVATADLAYRPGGSEPAELVLVTTGGGLGNPVWPPVHAQATACARMLWPHLEPGSGVLMWAWELRHKASITQGGYPYPVEDDRVSQLDAVEVDWAPRVALARETLAALLDGETPPPEAVEPPEPGTGMVWMCRQKTRRSGYCCVALCPHNWM
jgi:hypothetical protein